MALTEAIIAALPTLAALCILAAPFLFLIGVVIYFFASGKAPEEKKRLQTTGLVVIGVSIAIFISGLILSAIHGTASILQEQSSGLLRPE